MNNLEKKSKWRLWNSYQYEYTSNSFLICDLDLGIYYGPTARRLWLISAPSMRVCLSVSVTSEARSLPARSMKDILSKQNTGTGISFCHDDRVLENHWTFSVWNHHTQKSTKYQHNFDLFKINSFNPLITSSVTRQFLRLLCWTVQEW